MPSVIRLHVLRRQRPGRPRLFAIDRLLWVWLYRIWPRCLNAMVLVKPATVVQWHRKAFAYSGVGVTEAFPWDTAPRYLLRDRDASYGSEFCNRVKAMGIKEVVTAPRSPWQNPYVERVIGSIRREHLDHVVIFNERHLRRILPSYVDYYHRTRTHLSLDKDCPDPRPIMPRKIGKVVDIPQVGGLHHRYERLAA